MVQLQVNLIIIRPTAQAIVALTFANYAIQPFFPTCDSPDIPVRLLAAVCISEYPSASVQEMMLALFSPHDLIKTQIILFGAIVFSTRATLLSCDLFFRQASTFSSLIYHKLP